MGNIDSRVAAVAILLLLAERDAIAILEQLSIEDIGTLSRSVEYVDDLNRDNLMTVLSGFGEEFRNTTILSKSYQEKMQRALQRTLNKDKALTLLSKGGTESDAKKQNILDSLQMVHAEVMAGMLVGEPLQLQASVLSCLKADQGSQVMMFLPEESHEDLVFRIAGLQGLSQPALEAIAVILHSYLEEVRSEGEVLLKGVQHVADIMNLMDRDSTIKLLDDIRGKDQELVDNIERRMLLFEHLVRISNEDIRKVLSEIDQTVLATALKGANDDIKEKLLGGLSKRARSYAEDEIESLGALRKSAIEDARRTILKRVESLLSAGAIELSFSQEAVVE